MEIALDFARMLLEGDQLARTDRLDEATVIYQHILALGGIDRYERALAETRLERVRSEQTERAQPSIQAIEREPEPVVPTAEARAEALVNRGDLAAAIALYDEIAAADPGNALVRERVVELRALQRERAAERQAEVAASPPAADMSAVAEQAAQSVRAAVVELGIGATDWRQGLPDDPVILLQTLLERIQANRRAPA
ncbi:MAG: hypothetical protein JXR83_05375 [Deltaproteobacteria bacterium]|nr:hypothetical protein [Deltaproteobacteria bacterium]